MKRTTRILSLVLVLSMLFGMFAMAASAAPVNETAAAVTVDGMQVEYMTTPLGLDVEAPRFTWTLDSDARGVMQESYRIVAATSESALAEGPYVWDSGVQTGSAANGIAYTGSALEAETRYYWQVTSTTNKGVAVG